MHPTLIAMVAAEREVDIARAAERRSHIDHPSWLHVRSAQRFSRAPRGIGPTQVLAAARTALAQLISRPSAPQRRGAAGREVCCA